MKYIKIVQSGDFHLDSPLSLHHLGFRQKRREELLYAFKNVIDFARKEDAHLLLLTGDLFDSQRVTRKTLDFIVQSLATFTGKVFIAPGNHDPHTPGGIYEETKFPKNTHIFKSYEEVYLDDLDCLICGQGFQEEYSIENFLEGKIAGSRGAVKIMVMHGEVSSSPNSYNPISKESIKNCEFNYLALGHRHEYSGILREGKTSYAYAGIPEGRGFDEQGDKGLIYGKIYGHGVNLEFKEISQRTYEEITIEISGCLTTSDMVEKIKHKIGKQKVIYKVKLVGELPPYISVDLKNLEEILRRTVDDVTLYDETKVAQGEMNWGERSIQGLFIKAVEKKREESQGDDGLLQEAKTMGLRILGREKF